MFVVLLYVVMHVFLSTEFALRIVSAPMALDLALGTVCELLQRWGQNRAGVPVLLGWLLGDSDPKTDPEASAPVTLTLSCYRALGSLRFCSQLQQDEIPHLMKPGVHYCSINTPTIKKKNKSHGQYLE